MKTNMSPQLTTIPKRPVATLFVITLCVVSSIAQFIYHDKQKSRNFTEHEIKLPTSTQWHHRNGHIVTKRVSRQLDHHIPFAQSTGLIDSPESRTIAAGVCKAHCLKECASTLQQKSLTDTTIGDVLKALSQLPTQLRTECSRLSVGFLYYDECEQACESDRPYNECSRMCETGDSPSGWSCLTGCRILDAALKQRSGECPPTGGPAIHRLPGLMGSGPDDVNEPRNQGTDEDSVNNAHIRQSWFLNQKSKQNSIQALMCTVDAECPNKHDKCCQGQCKKATFREDLLPPIPTVRILEAKSPPSFLLSWERGLRMLNNLSEPIVYVLQVKTFFGPEFDNRLSSTWKTLVMSTLTGAQLSEPGIGWWYQFQVAAVNRWGSFGFELPTPPVQLTNHRPRAPSAPRDLSDGILTLHANGELRVEIHWSPPVSSSIPVTEYRIYWGPDAPHSPQETEFPEKPTQFVQTVPASQTSFLLTGLGPDTLYRIQLLAMSAWGTVQLRSEPSQLFLKTPPISHLHPPLGNGLLHRGSSSQWFQNNLQDASTKQMITDAETEAATEDILRKTTNGGTKSDQLIACVCDGTSKSDVLPSVVISDDDKTNRQELQLRTDPAVYDGTDIRVRLQLMRNIPAAVSANTEPQQFVVRWTPQVCIETKASLIPDIDSMKPESDLRMPKSSRSSSGQQYVTLMQMTTDRFGTQSGLINLSQQQRGHNESTIQYGELQLTRLLLNCRYLIQVYNHAENKPVASNDVSRGNRVQLSACLCTPTCTKVTLAPWISAVSCASQEKQSIPEPREVTHRLVQTTPLAYNITWLPGVSRSDITERTAPANRSDQEASRVEAQPVVSNVRGKKHRSSANIQNDYPTHYRVVWGPSQDQSINSDLWKTWPGLRPRIDPSLAETKVLRNGETSIMLSSLEPDTQYVVKLQAITGETNIEGDSVFQPGEDANRVSMRSAEMSQSSSLVVSKDVYLYFKTPSLMKSQKITNNTGDSTVYLQHSSCATGVYNASSWVIHWYGIMAWSLIYEYVCHTSG